MCVAANMNVSPSNHCFPSASALQARVSASARKLPAGHPMVRSRPHPLKRSRSRPCNRMMNCVTLAAFHSVMLQGNIPSLLRFVMAVYCQNEKLFVFFIINYFMLLQLYHMCFVFLIYCLCHPFKIPFLIDLVHHGSGLLMFIFVLMSLIVQVLCTVFFLIQLIRKTLKTTGNMSNWFDKTVHLLFKSSKVLSKQVLIICESVNSWTTCHTLLNFDRTQSNIIEQFL